MLLDGKLVVEHVDGRNPGPGGRQSEVIRTVGHGEVEGALGPAVQLCRALQQCHQLAETGSTRVMAHDDVIKPLQIEQT